MMPASQLEVPDGEGEQGGRAVLAEQVDLETRRPPGRGRRARRTRREWCRVSRAITQRPRASAPFFAGDVVGQAPRALGHRPLVQDVGADRVHLAPPPAGAELEHGVEGIVELRPAARLDVLDQPGAIRGERGLGEPSPDVRRRRPGEPAGRLRLGQPSGGLFRS